MKNDSLKILLIEDNPGDSRLIQEMLTEEAGISYQFNCVDTLSTGLETVATEKSDLILLDLGLPDSQGIQTLKRVQAKFPGKPTVVLTGLDSKELALEAVREGAQDYIVKGKINSGEGLWRVMQYAIERSRSERKLRESEDRLKEAQSLGKIGNWEYDVDTGTIEWSDEVYKLYERDKSLGTPTHEEEAAYYSTEQNKKLRACASLAIETGQDCSYDLKALLPGAKEVFFAATMHPVKNEQGEVVRLVGTVQDITARKLMEEQLLLSSKLASVGRLAAGLAHEINNPLTVIIGYAQLLQGRKEIAHDAKIDLDKIVQQGRRAAKVVQNLLRFSRGHKAELTRVDIGELINRTLDLQGYELKTSNIKIVTGLAENLPPIMADYNQIQQVIVNLILNAEQAITESGVGGTIRISSALDNEYIKICIFDDGPGIPPEHMNKIFEPFFTTKEIGKGSGLGLPICHGIISEHGGTINVKSEPVEGTVFTIKLPLNFTEELNSEAKPYSDYIKPDGETGKTGNVLVIDDEPLIRELLNRFLVRAGYSVEAVSSGQLALEKLEQGEIYSLFLVDIKMEEMSGNKFYGILKKRFPEMTERVIFLTGDIISKQTNDFLSDSGRPYLSKPFDYKGITGLVASTMRRKYDS